MMEAWGDGSTVSCQCCPLLSPRAVLRDLTAAGLQSLAGSGLIWPCVAAPTVLIEDHVALEEHSMKLDNLDLIVKDVSTGATFFRGGVGLPARP